MEGNVELEIKVQVQLETRDILFQMISLRLRKEVLKKHGGWSNYDFLTASFNFTYYQLSPCHEN